MPRFLIPKRSGVHRVACFALYRALLSQCASIPLADEQRTALWRLVRSTFRKYKNVQSPRLVNVALEAGYKALDLLHAAVDNNEASTLYISKLVSEAIIAKSRTRALSPTKTVSTVEERKKEQKGALQQRLPFRRPAPFPGATTVLEARPRLRLPAPRRIPKLVSATGIPFLRFKKPQSPFLSRVIRNKLKQRVNCFDQLRAMEEQYEVAAQEDLWDRVLYQTNGLSAGLTAGEMIWRHGVDYSLRDIKKKLRMQGTKSVDTAKRMQEIVNAEEELARKEKIHRRLQRKSRERGNAISTGDGYS